MYIYYKYTVRGYERISFRESLTRHFKAVKDTGCNFASVADINYCPMCGHELRKEPK